MSVDASLARSLITSLGKDCGVAAVVAEVLIRFEGLSVGPDAFHKAGIAPGDTPALDRTLADLQKRGWVLDAGSVWRSVSAAMPRGVPEFLLGASAMQRFGNPDVDVEPVVTMPLLPSKIGAALETTGVAWIRIKDTDAALMTIAREAITSFIILTPFLNKEGMTMVMNLLRACRPSVRRTLIIREWQVVREHIVPHAQELLALDVGVYDYFIHHVDKTYETFHAKICIADAEKAYVGSANMLVYANRSMECGVTISSASASKPIDSLIRAVIKVSTSVNL